MKKIISIEYEELNINSSEIYNPDQYNRAGIFKVFNPDLNGQAGLIHTWFVSVVFQNGSLMVYSSPWITESAKELIEKEEPLKEQIAGTVTEEFALKAIIAAKDPRLGLQLLTGFKK